MWQLTRKGKYVKVHGSPEFRVYSMVDPDNGVIFEIITQELGQVGKSGYEICLQENYLDYEPKKKIVFRKKDFPNDLIQFYLSEIENGYYFSKTIMTMLKKRNLIENVI
jgi:hypothetical protein